jgi:predicted glutamine amidotransferase
MLALFSVRRGSAFAPLLETDKSLLRQASIRRDQLQRDGWGVAWRESPSTLPEVFKSPRPLADDRAALRRAARRAQGTSVLFHLRRASNPRGLPIARMRGRRNLQPFSYGKWMFAHNGTVPFPDAAARRLGRFSGRVRGLNDSEILFWLIMKELAAGAGVPAAIRRTRRTLARVARETSPGAAPHLGLNVMLSDGKTFWAYAEAPAGARGTALATPDRPYSELAYLATPDRLWAASEPVWTGGDWRSLRSGELLAARVARGRIVCRKRRLISK